MANATEILVRDQGDVSVVSVKGDVTGTTGKPIEEAYASITAAGGKKILFLFDAGCYINSSGIAILIGVLAETKKRAQTVRMAGLSPHFQKIFSMVGLTKYAPIFPSENTALADF